MICAAFIHSGRRPASKHTRLWEFHIVSSQSDPFGLGQSLKQFDLGDLPCPRLPMVSAKPLTISLNQSKRLIVQSILDWFTDFLNSPGLIYMLD